MCDTWPLGLWSPSVVLKKHSKLITALQAQISISMNGFPFRARSVNIAF